MHTHTPGLKDLYGGYTLKDLSSLRGITYIYVTAGNWLHTSEDQ